MDYETTHKAAATAMLKEIQAQAAKRLHERELPILEHVAQSALAPMTAEYDWVVVVSTRMEVGKGRAQRPYIPDELQGVV